MADNKETVNRLQGYVTEMAQKYPKCWKQLEMMRAHKGGKLGDWPNWCYVPVAASYGVVSQGGMITDIERSQDVAKMHCLGAWRLTQGIYRFDETLFDELTKTPFTGDMPSELLFRLPEWCVYIVLERGGMNGVFVALEHDMNDGHPELRILMDTEDNELFSIPIHIEGDIKTGLEKGISFSKAQQKKVGSDSLLEWMEEAEDDIKELSAAMLGKIMSLILYLCSDSMDIWSDQAPDREPAYPSPKKTKKGPKYYPPPKPTVWQTGYRLGQFIKQQRERTTQGPGDSEGAGGQRVPHIRKAHWHTYWTGPRKQPELRQRELRWIPPLPIGFSWEDAEAELFPTIKKVR